MVFSVKSKYNHNLFSFFFREMKLFGEKENIICSQEKTITKKLEKFTLGIIKLELIIKDIVEKFVDQPMDFFLHFWSRIILWSFFLMKLAGNLDSQIRNETNKNMIETWYILHSFKKLLSTLLLFEFFFAELLHITILVSKNPLKMSQDIFMNCLQQLLPTNLSILTIGNFTKKNWNFFLLPFPVYFF